MVATTIKELASEIGIPSDRLVVRLAEAGIKRSSENDTINHDDKLKLLRHLGGARGGINTEKASVISLRRRSTAIADEPNADSNNADESEDCNNESISIIKKLKGEARTQEVEADARGVSYLTVVIQT